MNFLRLALGLFASLLHRGLCATDLLKPNLDVLYVDLSGVRFIDYRTGQLISFKQQMNASNPRCQLHF
jgi:hypothetical protein